MNPRTRGHGKRNELYGILLVGIIIGGSLGVILVYNPAGLFKLALGGTIPSYPTNPFYDPTAGYSNFKERVQADKGVLSAQAAIGTCGNPTGPLYISPPGSTQCSPNNCLSPGSPCQSLYTANAGTLYIPFGGVADGYLYVGRGLLSDVSAGTWTVKAPGDLSSSTCLPAPVGSGGNCVDTASFDLAGTVIGANGGILLQSAAPTGDPTCSNFAMKTGDQSNANTCWQTDYSIVQAAQAQNPPCINGVTVCYPGVPVANQTNIVATVIDPFINGVLYNAQNCPNNQYNTIVNGHCQVTRFGNQTVTTTWYLYREITSLQLQIFPPSPSIGCSATGVIFTENICSGNDCVGCNANNALRPAMANFVSEINNVALLSNTRIAFGLSVTGFAGLTCTPADVQAGLCWYGIIGAWIGGQGMQTSGCTAGTNANSCTFVQGSHTQLSIFQDPGLTQSAAVPPVDQLVNLAQLTGQTVAQVTQQNVYGQVFTYIDTKGLGVTYYYGGDSNCNYNSLSGCIGTPIPVIVNVPLVYDIIGGKSLAAWLYKYPGIPPVGGKNSGTITGTAYDSSSKNILGQYSGVAGICVSLQSPCSGQPGQYQTTTDGNGNFVLNNVPVGTYALYMTDPQGNFNTWFASTVPVAIGTTTTIQPAYLIPSTPPGQVCIGRINNPVPFQPPIFPGLCVPSWVPWVGLAAGLGLVAIVILAYSPFGGSLLAGAGTGLGNLIGRSRGGPRKQMRPG